MIFLYTQVTILSLTSLTSITLTIREHKRLFVYLPVKVFAKFIHGTKNISDYQLFIQLPSYPKLGV